MHEDALSATIGQADFVGRFSRLHRQLWASTDFAFDAVTAHVFAPPKGLYQVDHSFIHDGRDWHVFYVTGDMKLSEPWNARRAAGDWKGANEVCVEPGNGHAVGPNLWSLRFKENVFFPPQGTFDLGSRACCSMFKFKDCYGMLYDVRGDRGDLMSVAWSKDLSTWELDPANPVLAAPPWAARRSAFKDPHVMFWKGVYLIYAVVWEAATALPGVGLITTDDWVNFHDQGIVFRAIPYMRGTFGLESPQVIHRDGVWHLFYTMGAGLWHAVSPSPTAFLESEIAPGRAMRGAYWMGPFHATEVVQDDDDRWWLTTDRKEETRRLNRVAGRMCWRGTYEDEKTLEEGIYLSKMMWEGDQPLLQKPRI